MRLYKVIRVDRKPEAWFKGYDKDGRTEVTTDPKEAVEILERDVEIVKHDMTFEHGGVWSAREVRE